MISEDKSHRQRLRLLIQREEKKESRSMIPRSLVYKRIVMPSDLNPAGYLFGGSMMKWMDEAGAIFGCELLGPDRHFVTLKVSEVLFKHPAPLGAVLTFYASLKNIGKTSFEVEVEVHKNDWVPTIQSIRIATCNITFVSIDKNGRPTPHNLLTDINFF